MKRKVLSVSLPVKYFQRLERLTKDKDKSRSQVIREMLDKYETDEEWSQIYKWGRQTARKFNIKSEEDVLRIIND